MRDARKLSIEQTGLIELPFATIHIIFGSNAGITAHVWHLRCRVEHARAG